jgi:hypothetical protein
MGFWDKFKKATDAVEPAVKIASVVAPGRAGDIARIVERVISNDADPQNLGALRQLANEIVELKMRVAHLEDVLTRR